MSKKGTPVQQWAIVVALGVLAVLLAVYEHGSRGGIVMTVVFVALWVVFRAATALPRFVTAVWRGTIVWREMWLLLVGCAVIALAGEMYGLNVTVLLIAVVGIKALIEWIGVMAFRRASTHRAD